MPSFTGVRQRKFFVALAARDAIETLMETSEWPCKSWSVQRIRKIFAYLDVEYCPAPDWPLTWYALDSYISREERADKYQRLRKLLPF